MDLLNRKIRPNQMSLVIYLVEIYRVLSEVYSKQFIREVERDLDKNCTTKLVEIMDQVRSLNELNKEKVNVNI